MNLSRIALLCACIALPAGRALAQPTNSPQVIQVPPGAVVLILGAPVVPTDGSPVVTTAMSGASPMLRLIAEQQAMMQRMMADMDALFRRMPDPVQATRAAMAGATGLGVCDESVTYTFNGNGSKPVVHVTHFGDACGAAGAGGAQNVTVPQQTVPERANHPKVLEVGYPAHPLTHGVPPRT